MSNSPGFAGPCPGPAGGAAPLPARSHRDSRLPWAGAALDKGNSDSCYANTEVSADTLIAEGLKKEKRGQGAGRTEERKNLSFFFFFHCTVLALEAGSRPRGSAAGRAGAPTAPAAHAQQSPGELSWEGVGIPRVSILISLPVPMRHSQRLFAQLLRRENQLT